MCGKISLRFRSRIIKEVQGVKVFLTVVHVIVSIAVMAVILMQQRKQGGFTGVFGGGTQADAAGQWQRFTLLTKATIVLTAVFLATSLILVIVR
ncbi:MAG: preprotein translocase subunit SecG [Syntrophobacterales bacterium]|nr:preprotein translocase subunit SecG [Syntrophobacterales bacterium]